MKFSNIIARGVLLQDFYEYDNFNHLEKVIIIYGHLSEWLDYILYED